MVSAMSVRLNDRASHSRYFSDELTRNFFVKKERMFTE
jgi:hypothetical protein